MDIPLTSFIDFVLKSGSPKMTSAKKIKSQSEEDYNVATDYYKRFREAVQELHKKDLQKATLLKIVGPLPPNKVENYKKMAEGYKKFLGRKGVKWFKPSRENWKQGNLNIAINPELGLEWDGKKYLVKLYLKAEKPSKDRLASILALMNHTIVSTDCTFAVLDVRNSKIYTYENEMDLMMPLVEGEAKALESILSQI
ncbi:hypothetical protein [Algoriphagus aquimarinus]|uniref:hypothetical protein n=1 Tax=Algoriphagus aquimarinus TaxID=237018 RepID=UPI0030DD0DF8